MKERIRLVQVILCSPRKLCRARTLMTRTFYLVFSQEIVSRKNAPDMFFLDLVFSQKMCRERIHTDCTFYLVFSLKIASRKNETNRTFSLVFSLKIVS